MLEDVVVFYMQTRLIESAKLLRKINKSI